MKTGNILHARSTIKDLPDVRSFVREHLDSLHVEPDDAYDILLVVTEIVTNSLIHGYQGKPGVIEVELLPDGGALVMYLRDQAPPFDPTQVPAPDTTIPLEKRPIGGLGVHLVRQLTDQMSYRNSPQWNNEIILIKRDVIPFAHTEDNDGIYC